MAYIRSPFNRLGISPTLPREPHTRSLRESGNTLPLLSSLTLAVSLLRRTTVYYIMLGSVGVSSRAVRLGCLKGE
jgi:hypothetical protein